MIQCCGADRPLLEHYLFTLFYSYPKDGATYIIVHLFTLPAFVVVVIREFGAPTTILWASIVELFLHSREKLLSIICL